MGGLLNSFSGLLRNELIICTREISTPLHCNLLSSHLLFTII
jgi:hypothetical protein